MESPLAAYYLVLGATVALVVLGLIMVLSSSSVESLRSPMRSSYAVFAKQAMFAAIGLPLACLAAALPLKVWKALGWPLLALAVLGLAAVMVVGSSVQGNRNWLSVGGVSLQPSEASKLALVVWSASVLSRKEALLDRVPHMLVPVVPGACLVLALVLAGRDLGTSLVLMALTAALLFSAGAPLRIFAATGVVAAALVALLVASSPNRMSRVGAWLGGHEAAAADLHGMGWQTTHAAYALASGGWWGVGLGASREKWLWLPEAHNDFIFAIIGEELGLAGTLAVLALFAVLGLGLCRLVLATDDLFVKVATGGVLAWVLGQAIVNVGAVTGLLPVIGVPLPLVSSGGSALVTTLVALGMVLGFARRVPGAPEALASRPRVVRRSFAVVPGRPGRAGGSVPTARAAAPAPRSPAPAARHAGTGGGPSRPARVRRPRRPGGGAA
jgi:cell division protein FtsW